MDLVLEVADHYVLDDLYAKVLPASLAANIPVKWQKLLGLNSGFSNSTILQETLNSKNAVKECRRFYGQVPFLFDMSTTSLHRYCLVPASWENSSHYGLLLRSLVYYFTYSRLVSATCLCLTSRFSTILVTWKTKWQWKSSWQSVLSHGCRCWPLHGLLWNWTAILNYTWRLIMKTTV